MIGIPDMIVPNTGIKPKIKTIRVSVTIYGKVVPP